MRDEFLVIPFPDYLEVISSDRLVPYLEGGIGVFYTDFQVEGQGSRINFIRSLF
jgi:hypothetical protein